MSLPCSYGACTRVRTARKMPARDRGEDHREAHLSRDVATLVADAANPSCPVRHSQNGMLSPNLLFALLAVIYPELRRQGEQATSGSDGHTRLTPVAITGIVVGVGIVVACLLLLLFIWITRRRRSHARSARPTGWFTGQCILLIFTSFVPMIADWVFETLFSDRVWRDTTQECESAR